MFTGEVPHGTDFRLIAAVAPGYEFLDPVVAQMIKQNPSDRPDTIARVKSQIERFRGDAVSRQRLNQLTGQVVSERTIDDALALSPPVLVGAEWDGSNLRLKLDRAVNGAWVSALNNMGSYSAVMGYDPSRFRFQGDTAIVDAPQHSVQGIVDSFKAWLPIATRTLRSNLEQKAEKDRNERLQQLGRERELEASKIRVNQSIRL